MLKAKTRTNHSKGMIEAMKEIQKEHNEAVVFARVTKKEMNKLKLYLLKEEITIGKWVKNMIARINVKESIDII